MASKKTPWFKWPVRPVREGWYDFRGYLMPMKGLRLYWNGSQFGYWIDSTNQRGWVHQADDVDDEWRGATTPPAANRSEPK